MLRDLQYNILLNLLSTYMQYVINGISYFYILVMFQMCAVCRNVSVCGLPSCNCVDFTY